MYSGKRLYIIIILILIQMLNELNSTYKDSHVYLTAGFYVKILFILLNTIILNVIIYICHYH